MFKIKNEMLKSKFYPCSVFLEINLTMKYMGEYMEIK